MCRCFGIILCVYANWRQLFSDWARCVPAPRYLVLFAESLRVLSILLHCKNLGAVCNHGITPWSSCTDGFPECHMGGLASSYFLPGSFCHHFRDSRSALYHRAGLRTTDPILFRHSCFDGLDGNFIAELSRQTAAGLA